MAGKSNEDLIGTDQPSHSIVGHDGTAVGGIALADNALLLRQGSGNIASFGVALHTLIGRQGGDLTGVSLGTNEALMRAAGDIGGVPISDGHFVAREPGSDLASVSAEDARTMQYPNTVIVDTGPITTTDDTPTTVFSYVTLADDTVTRLKLSTQVLEASFGDAALFETSILIHRNGSSVLSEKSLIHNIQFTELGVAVTVDLSGTTINVQITGMIGETIEWAMFGTLQEL